MTLKRLLLSLSAVGAALFMSVAGAYACSGDGSVRFTVTNIDSSKGRVRLGVFATEKEWRRLIPATWEYSARARKGSVSMCIKPPKRGKFAVLAYHDADNDRLIDNEEDNLLFFKVPLPTEAIGIGNDARLKPYPPFARSTVEFDGPAKRSKITLKHCKIRGVGFSCGLKK